MVGMIVRAEQDRGLGIQTKDAWDHLRPKATLVVTVADGRDADTSIYTGNVRVARLENGSLPYSDMMWLIDQSQVIYTVETAYDWSLIRLAGNRGIPTVIQGNPEFFEAHLDSPTEWWWATDWRPVRDMPRGRHMPVPMDNPGRSRSPRASHPLRIVHVVGRPAIGDRNGTNDLLRALMDVKVPYSLHVSAFHYSGIQQQLLRHLQGTGNQISWDGPVEDRWAIYENADVLILPRRYGGLCLPALEARAMGVKVMMTECPPNYQHADVLVPGWWSHVEHLKGGRVKCFSVNLDDLTAAITKEALSDSDSWIAPPAYTWADALPEWNSRLAELTL